MRVARQFGFFKVIRFLKKLTLSDGHSIAKSMLRKTETNSLVILEKN